MEQMDSEKKICGEDEGDGKPTESLDCDICGKTFKTKYKLRRHTEIHKERKKYKCEVCGSILTGKDSFKKHLKRHRNQGKVKNDMQEQNNEDELVLEKETGGEVCDICGKDFKTKSQLKKHGRVHNKTNQYSCDICRKEFTHKYLYVRHCKKHKDTENGKNEQKNQKPVVVCKVCGQIFSSMNTFRVHKKKHLGIRYYCTRCAQSFTTTHQLKLHEKAHDDVRNFHCLQCSSKFKTKSNLTRHMATHEGTRKFVCHVCGKAFVLNESLAVHMRVHEDIPLQSCDICQATFKYEKSLKTHLKLHSNLKEFKCTICNREFLRKRTLEDHLKCHEKGTSRVALISKPSEFCSLCSKGFANAYGLRRHMRKHRLGILKHYNRARGKNSSIRSEGNDSTSQNVQTKKKVSQRNQVAVYSNLVDNGNLFEKIYPKCFVEKSSEIISGSEDHSELNEFVDSSQGTSEDVLMANDYQIPIEDSNDDIEATEDENHSELNDIGTCLVSSPSLDLKAKGPDTVNKLLDTDYQNKTGSDHSFDTSTESCNSVNELKDTSKISDIENILERVSNDNSDASLDTEYVDDAIYIEKGTDTVDTIAHFTKDDVNDRRSTEKDNDLIDQPEDDNDIDPYVDTSKFSDNENVTLATRVTYSNNSNDIGNIVELDVKEGKNREHDDEKVAENPNRSFHSKRDVKWVDRIDQENIEDTNKLQKEELEVMQENQEYHHVNYGMDTEEEVLCLECTICKTGKQFKNKDSFKRHMRKYHKGNSECLFECSKCLRQFFIEAEYEAHIRNENHDSTCGKNAPNLQCKFCMTNYSNLKSLKMHLGRYHRDDDGTIYTCDHCGKMFASRVLYRNHVDIHIIGKSNTRQLCECDICGSEHKSLLALRRHKRVSHGIEEDDQFTVDSEENGIVELENHMKIRGDNFDREEAVEDEVNGDEGLNEDGKPNAQLFRYEDLNGDSSEKRDSCVPDLYAENMNKSCERVNKEQRNDNEMYSEHEEDENGSVHDIDLAMSKAVEAEIDRNIERRRDFHIDDDGRSNQDLTVNSSTKERFQRKFQCIECDKSFHMMSTLKQHMLGHKNQSNDKVKIFNCGQCDQKFVRKSQLMTHTHKFHSKFTYSCNLCPRKFTSVFCLRTHKCVKLGQSKHVDKTKQHSDSKLDKRTRVNYECDVCSDMFTKHCCFQVHLRTHTTGRYQCPVCKINFTKWLNLKQHKISKHGKEQDSAIDTLPNANTLSDATLPDANTLSDTLSDANLSLKEDMDTGASEEGISFKCLLCSAALSSESNLNRHMRLKHNRSDNLSNCETCQECEEILKESLNEQEKLKVRKKRAFPCEKCDQTFPSKLMLRKHLNNVHNVIFNYCNKCSKEFSSLSNLKRHESIHHSGGEDVQRNFMCSECGRCFTAKDSLRVHMFSHTGERPYKCKQCDASYSRSSHLLRHVKVSHEGKLDYVCNFEGCGKRFYEASVLRIHQRSHTDERPYSCPHCTQRFRTMNNKRTHLKTHSMVKQFECHICLQGLTSKNSLTKHLERHEAADKMNPNSALFDPNFRVKLRQKVVKKMEEKRFGCSYCSKTFTTTRGVYAHQRKYCEGAKRDGIVENNGRYYILQ